MGRGGILDLGVQVEVGRGGILDLGVQVEVGRGGYLICAHYMYNWKWGGMATGQLLLA